MRPITAALADAERNEQTKPRHTATVRREVMRRLANNYKLSATADTDIPQNYYADGSVIYAAFRAKNGAAYLRVSGAGDLEITNAAQLDDGNTPGAMRFGLAKSGQPLYVYRAVTQNAQWRLQRSAITGATNPLSLSFSDYSPLFGYGGTDSAEFVRRIEAICPLADGRVLVADGSHQFTTGMSYIRFYLADAWNVIQLHNVIEMPLAETRTTWQGVAKYATRITAASTSAGVVIAGNADPDGHAVTWTLANGVESEMATIAPTDPEADNARILPNTITEINGLLYLTARVVSAQTDNSGAVARTGRDVYLTASNATPGLWSFGEQGSWLAPEPRNGTMLLMPGTNTGGAIAYVGNGSLALFETTPVQYPVSGTDATSRMAGWELAQISDGADEFTTTLGNGDGLFDDNADVSADSVLYLKSGQGGELADVGAYAIDEPGRTIDQTGRNTLSIHGSDLGHKTLVQGAPLAGQIFGRSAWRSDLKTLDGLTRKTPDRAWSAGIDGLTHDGLNEPFVALFDAQDHGDSLTKLTVRMECNNPRHRGAVGVVLGARESDDDTTASGNVVIIPKSSADTAAPVINRLKLGVDGWELERRMRPLATAIGEATAITENAGAGYVTSENYAIPANADTDIAVRVFGEYVCVFTRAHVMTPTACAANAKYVLRSRARFSRTARRRYGRATRAGIALSHDVFASKSAFSGAFFKDLELSLTDAQIAHGTNAGVYYTPLSGLLTEVESPPGTVSATVTGANTKFLTECHVGQLLRFGDHVRAVQGITSDTQMSCDPAGASVFSRVVSGQVFIKSGEGFAWCTSAHTEKVVGDDLTIRINPGAVKHALITGGAGIIISDDNTAHSKRWVKSDGVNHYLMDAGWDPTNPIPDGSPGHGDSEPNAWRIVYRAALIAEQSAASYGMPSGNSSAEHVVVDDEVVRYKEISFTAWHENLSSTAYQNTRTWMVCPTYFIIPALQYAPLAAIAPLSGGSFSVAEAGMLLEYTSRNAGGESGYFSADNNRTTTQFYVAAKSGDNIIPGKYDAPFGSLTPASAPGDLNPRELVILSGRGAFGTAKTSHKPDAPVAYYPIGTDGKTPKTIVKRAGFWSGRYLSLEDAIARICTLAGMRKARFRNADIAVTGAVSISLASGATQTVSARNVADFALHMSVTLAPAGAASVYFRDFYKLDLSQPAPGVVGISLQTTKTASEGGVDAHNGLRTLEAVDVPVSDFNLTASIAARVVAMADEVIVEIAGQPVWTFDLTALRDDTYNYAVNTAAPVKIGATGAGINATARMLELCGEVGAVNIDAQQNAMSAIETLLREDTHVHHRATPDGGVEFSTFWTRDTLAPVTGLIAQHKYGGAGNAQNRVGHVLAQGDGAAGEWFDDDTLARHGYRFEAIQAGGARTVEQAQNEARLYLRECKEWGHQHVMSGFGLVEAQAEDKINVAYQPPAGHPSMPPTDFVISKITLNAEVDALRATYELREAHDP